MDELAKLIMSLTKAEKRYFKMFTAMQSGEKSYLKLFDSVEKIGDYDEAKIRKMHKNEDFIKRLPAVKNYLYNQILKSLRVVYDSSTVTSQIKGMLEDVAILYDKRLYKQSLKIVERAKDLAKNSELILLLIEIKSWEEKILKETLDIDKFEKFHNVLLEEEEELLNRQRKISEYRHLYNEIFLLNRKVKEARTEEELLHFRTIIDHPLLQDINNAVGFECKHYFYLTHLIYNHAKGDHEASLHYAADHLKLIESFPEVIKERPKLYVSALNNLLLCQIHLHRYDQFDDALNKLKNFPTKSLSLEVNIFISANTFEMVKYLDSGEFHKGVVILKDILDGLEKFHDKLNPIEESILLYNVFYLYFGTGQYSKALGIINKLINEYQKDLRYDIQCAVKILNLILHYELGNKTLLEYNAVSTYRYLYKSKRLYKLESVVLNFIRKKMPDINTAKEQIEAFKELRHEFESLNQDPYEKKAFEYFDYISWLDSKIENKPFEEIVKAKFNANVKGKTV